MDVLDNRARPPGLYAAQEAQEQGEEHDLEVHPTEIAFDIASAERAIEAVDGHPAFGFNYDPSHLGYQGVDYVKFIYRFSKRIFHVHMKDVGWSLTPTEAEHFLDKGYVTIPGCFTRNFAQPLINHAYERMGCDPNDPATWTEPIRYLDHAHKFNVKELCPKAWGAICDILGGEDRIDPTVRRMETNHFSSVESFKWSDAFIVNFRYGTSEPWRPPAPPAGFPRAQPWTT